MIILFLFLITQAKPVPTAERKVSSIEAPECIKNGKIRWLYNGKMISETSSYCTNQNRSTIISSKCLKSNCQALEVDPYVNVESFIKPVGTPGFLLCHHIGGVPQIIEYQAEGKWHSHDRCLFEDKSYIDTATLFSRFRDALDHYK